MRQWVQFALLFLPVLAWAQVDPVENPAPGQAFKGYATYELKPLTVAPEYANNETAEKVRVKVEENLQAKLKPVLESFQQMDQDTEKKGTLVFEPYIKEMRFISGGKRFWAGGLAGNSHITLLVKVTDAETGKLIAQPEFYQRASAMAGAWTFGAHDNSMLGRVVDLAANYARTNYESAVGGPTGRDKN